MNLAALEAQVRQVERQFLAQGQKWQGAARKLLLTPVGFGVDEIDHYLINGGLPRAALHEWVGGWDGGASALIAFMAGRFAGRGLILWCVDGSQSDHGQPHVPGLHHYGLPTHQLMMVFPRRPSDVLWVMEEALRSGQIALVVGECHMITLEQSRRLHLAAEQSGASLLLWRRAGGLSLSAAPNLSPTAAYSRWQIATVSAPSLSPEVQEPAHAALGWHDHWQITLLRCRGLMPRSWKVVFDHETSALRLATEPRQ